MDGVKRGDDKQSESFEAWWYPWLSQRQTANKPAAIDAARAEWAAAIKAQLPPTERIAELGIHDDYWHSVAISFGEKLCATGPAGYYKFTPREWYEWCDRQLQARLSAKTPPLDPTPAMIEAGAQRLVRWETGKEKWPNAWSKMDVRAARNDAERCWRSMWLEAEAAAQPTEEAPTEGGTVGGTASLTVLPEVAQPQDARAIVSKNLMQALREQHAEDEAKRGGGPNSK